MLAPLASMLASISFAVTGALAAGNAPAGAKAAAPAADRRPTVAVLYFDYAGGDPQLDPLRKGLAQMLISDLTAVDAVRIVERERLEAVLAEHKLASGKAGTKVGEKIDQRTAVKLGKLLGARYLVLGSFFDVLKSFRVDARLVDVETGQVMQSVGADGKADDFLGLEQTVASGMRDAVGHLGPAAAGAGERPAGADTRRPRPRLPKRLKTDTALKYGQALAALDAGKKADARTLLGNVLTDQPDFELASRDLERLMQ